MNDYYFYHLTNQHHADVKEAERKESCQAKAAKAITFIGTCAVILSALYWLATLGV